MNNLSASGIMMSSQLRNENIGGTIRDNCHATCSDLVVDILRGILSRVRRAGMAIAQTSRAIPEVCAIPLRLTAQRVPSIQSADQHVRPCTPRILGVRRD